MALAGDTPALDPRNVCVMGARDVDAGERAFVKEHGLRVYSMSELDERGTAVCAREAVERCLDGTVGIHLSFDLDGVDPQHAPGVGTAVGVGSTFGRATSSARRWPQRARCSASKWWS